ncbi:MCP four helix bundle domain-containing protein [Gemmobacter lanyuensis]
MTDHTDTAQAASARTDAQSPPPGGFGISLKTKIIGAAILLSVILVAMGLISYERFGEIRQNTRAIVQQNLPRMAEAARLDLAQQEIQTLIRDYALRPDATTRKPVQNQIDDLRKEQQIRLTHARDGATAASMKLLDEYAAKTAQINALIDGIFAADKNATAAGSAATGILQEGKLAALATEIKDIATRLGQEERLQAQRMAKASETIFWQVMALLRNFVIAGVAGAFAAGIWIMVSLTRGLRATGQLSASVAEGNLLVAPRLRGNDEMTALLGNMNRMVLAMRSVVADVAQGSVRSRAGPRKWRRPRPRSARPRGCSRWRSSGPQARSRRLRPISLKPRAMPRSRRKPPIGLWAWRKRRAPPWPPPQPPCNPSPRRSASCRKSRGRPTFWR